MSDRSRTILPNVVVCVVVDRVGSCQQARAPCPFHEQEQGREDFFYSCPAAWNNLPSALRILHQSVSDFKKNLKTFLFQNRFSCNSYILCCLIRILFRYQYFDSCCGRLPDEHLLGVALFKFLFTITITIAILFLLSHYRSLE